MGSKVELAPWADSEPHSSWSNKQIKLIQEESRYSHSIRDLKAKKEHIWLSILGEEMNSSWSPKSWAGCVSAKLKSISTISVS